MNYQVLARRLRPRKFSEVVGQDHVTQALLNSIKRSSLHHAYLLTGTRGVGKTTIARIFAKSLNCPQAVEGEPCGDCEVCQSIDEGKFTDLLELDAASNTGIDSIRELLDNAVYLPVEGKYKVYLIDEVHMLSKSAFNAMLKTLEEPPDHVKFILATTDPQKVPITVLSRCLQLILRNLSAGEIQSYLEEVLRKEGVSHEPVAVSIISRAAAGSMRDALSLLDQAIALGNGVVCAQLVKQMLGFVEREHL
ncbi:MAG: DNA polymerase III subunit gamma/tau [Neisseriaceae bacterium]